MFTYIYTTLPPLLINTLTSKTTLLFSTPFSQNMVMMKHQILSLPLFVMIFFSSITILAQKIPAPAPDDAGPTDIIRILKKAGGYTTLIRLLQTTQVSTQIDSQLLTSNGGITFFAPNDNAFSSLKPGFLNSLNDEQKNKLVQFHLLPTFVSTTNFDTLSNPVRTQAGDDSFRLGLNVSSSGNQVNLTTGIVNATVGGTVYTDRQLAVYQVDKVLLPRDFFVAKTVAPAPAPEKAKASSSKKKSADNDVVAGDDDSAASASASAAASVKQQCLMSVPVAVATITVALFSW